MKNSSSQTLSTAPILVDVYGIINLDMISAAIGVAMSQ